MLMTRIERPNANRVAYNIYRNFLIAEPSKNYTFTYTQYKWDTCPENTCKSFQEMYPDFDTDNCSGGKTQNREFSAQIEEIFTKLYEEPEVQDNREWVECPYCEATDKEDFDACVLDPDYNLDITDCNNEADGVCSIVYKAVEGDWNSPKCYVLRACGSRIMSGLHVKEDWVECQDDLCNNQSYHVECRSDCLESQKDCLINCNQDPLCSSACNREYDSCMSLCL